MILWFWYFKSLLYEQFLYQNVKAIGGSGVKKLYQAYFVELVAVVSKLFTTRQNSPVLEIWPMQFSGVLTFIYGKRGVIFGDFLSIFACKIFNIDIESTKVVLKIQTMDRIKKKSWQIIFFENFGKNWAISSQNAIVLQKCDLFKITFCVITWAWMTLETWNFVNICRKNLQKTQGKRNFEFLIFFSFIEFFV